MYFINGVGGITTQKYLLEQAELGIDICSNKFKSKLLENITKYYIQEHKKDRNLTFGQKNFLRLLEKTTYNSAGYKYLINEVGRFINPSYALSGHKNFGEQINDILKRTNRKVHHQIHTVEKLRKLKLELEQCGKWESIKSYLNSDFTTLKEENNQSTMFYPKLLERELDLDIAN